MLTRKDTITFTVVFFILFFGLVSTVSGNTNSFSDVKVNSSHYKGVEWLKGKGINGCGGGKFCVEDPLYREQAAIMFTRAMSLDDSGKASDYFNDIRNNYIYANYIVAVGKAGIFKGANGKFGASDQLTREQMASTLVKAFDLDSNGKKVNINLKNVDTSHKKSVQLLADLKITNQTKDFRPNEVVKRGQFATFLKKANDVVSERPELDDFSNKELKRMNEINAKWSQLQPTYDGEINNVEPVVTPPYRLGSVNNKALKDALNVTNFVRYLSYLPSNITLDNAFTKEAQAAAVVNGANQVMTHEPKLPYKMKKDDPLYISGYKGAGTSNIGYGYHTIANSIKDGYMPDSDTKNREKVAHRRWILSPRLQKVGFGFAVATSGTPHTAMKVIEDDMWKNNEAKHNHILWPAETVFPSDFFGQHDPWSVSLNPSNYDATKTKDISVLLTRVKDGKTWKFNRIGSSSDGFFTINTENLGFTPFTIIFQPKQTGYYQAGEHYKVEINGLYTKSGSKTKFQFETTFFELN